MNKYQNHICCFQLRWIGGRVYLYIYRLSTIGDLVRTKILNGAIAHFWQPFSHLMGSFRLAFSAFARLEPPWGSLPSIFFMMPCWQFMKTKCEICKIGGGGLASSLHHHFSSLPFPSYLRAQPHRFSLISGRFLTPTCGAFWVTKLEMPFGFEARFLVLLFIDSGL